MAGFWRAFFFGLLIGPVAALASAAPSSPVNMATVGAFLEKEQPGDAPSTATGRGTSLPSIYRIAQTRSPLGGVRDAWTKFSEDFSRTMKPYFGDLGAAKDWFAERAQLLRFNVEGTITRSKYQEPNADALEGGRLSGVFAPALRLTEDSTLILLYNGRYNRELQIFTEDEGPRQRSVEQRHEIIALLATDYVNPFGSEFINRVTVSPSFFQTYVFTRQTANEDWGNGNPLGGIQKFKGLYDYWDRGVGLDVKIVHERGEGRNDVLSAAFQYYRRHYRNFISLARLQDPSSTEPKFEKDYYGILGQASYEHQYQKGLAYKFSYTYLRKRFAEDLADNDPLEDTTTIGERRKDETHTLSSRIAYPLPMNLVGSLSGTLVFNFSNSGFNDTLSPLSSVGVFTDDYYDYWSGSLAPELSHTRKVNLWWMGAKRSGDLTLSAAYSVERRSYRGRPAKDKDGTLKFSNEVDYTHTISPQAVLKFHDNWALLLQARRVIARSNVLDERTFRYNYDLNTFSVGLFYRF